MCVFVGVFFSYSLKEALDVPGWDVLNLAGSVVNNIMWKVVWEKREQLEMLGGGA